MVDGMSIDDEIEIRLRHVDDAADIFGPSRCPAAACRPARSSTCSLSLKVSIDLQQSCRCRRWRCRTGGRTPLPCAAGRDRSRPSRYWKSRSIRQTRGASAFEIVASSQARLAAKVEAPTPPAMPCTGKHHAVAVALGLEGRGVRLSRRRLPRLRRRQPGPGRPGCGLAHAFDRIVQRAFGQRVGHEIIGPQPQQLVQRDRADLIGDQHDLDRLGLGRADDLGDPASDRLRPRRPRRWRRIPAPRRRAVQGRPAHLQSPDRPSFRQARVPCRRSADRNSAHRAKSCRPGSVPDPVAGLLRSSFASSSFQYGVPHGPACAQHCGDIGRAPDTVRGMIAARTVPIAVETAGGMVARLGLKDRQSLVFAITMSSETKRPAQRPGAVWPFGGSDQPVAPGLVCVR